MAHGAAWRTQPPVTLGSFQVGAMHFTTESPGERDGLHHGVTTRAPRPSTASRRGPRRVAPRRCLAPLQLRQEGRDPASHRRGGAAILVKMVKSAVSVSNRPPEGNIHLSQCWCAGRTGHAMPDRAGRTKDSPQLSVSRLFRHLAGHAPARPRTPPHTPARHARARHPANALQHGATDAPLLWATKKNNFSRLHILCFWFESVARRTAASSHLAGRPGLAPQHIIEIP